MSKILLTAGSILLATTATLTSCLLIVTIMSTRPNVAPSI